MIDWFAVRPIAFGVLTFLLMCLDWFLSVLQHREHVAHSDRHYRSYPVDTVEGNPLLQHAIRSGAFVQPRHLLAAIGVSVLAALALPWIPHPARPAFLGYVWGLFLIVSCTHVGNLLGSIASRRGVHGRLWIHQRTAYWIQAARHVALALLLGVLALASFSSFVAGVALAAFVSAGRQLAWVRRVPPVPEPDLPPEAPTGEDGGPPTTIAF